MFRTRRCLERCVSFYTSYLFIVYQESCALIQLFPFIDIVDTMTFWCFVICSRVEWSEVVGSGGCLRVLSSIRERSCCTAAKMAVIEICLIVTGVLIFTVANVIVIKHYVRDKTDKKRVDEKARAVYKPAEQDNMGHLYY